MVSSREKDAVRRLKVRPRWYEPIDIGFGAVKQITDDENNIRTKAREHTHDPFYKRVVSYMTQVHVAHQCRDAAAPRAGQIWQSNGDAGDSCPSGVDDATKADEQCRAKNRNTHSSRLPVQACEDAQTRHDPGGACGKEEIIQHAEPNRSDDVKHAHENVEIPECKQRGGDEAYR